jgi:hypothetical protein
MKTTVKCTGKNLQSATTAQVVFQPIDQTVQVNLTIGNLTIADAEKYTIGATYTLTLEPVA